MKREDTKTKVIEGWADLYGPDRPMIDKATEYMLGCDPSEPNIFAMTRKTTTPEPLVSLPENIRKRITIDRETGCWNWTGSKTDGYGYASVNGKLWRVHRFVYTKLRGPIPDGMVTDHLCRNRGCSNPDHIEVVTNRENVIRGIGISAKNLTKTHCPHGHPYGPTTIVRGSPTRVCLTCRRAYDKRRRALSPRRNYEYNKAYEARKSAASKPSNNNTGS